MNGWVKLFNKLLDWGWYRDIPTKVLWIHLLLKAYWQDGCYQGEMIRKGSFPTSVSQLAIETGLTPKQTRLALNKLEKTGEVVTKRANKYTVISIVKWADYQGYELDEGKQRDTEKGSPRGSQREHILLDEEEKKRRLYINAEPSPAEKPFVKPSLEEVTQYCIANGYSEVDAQKFIDYYEKNNWTVKERNGSRRKMKNWKLCLNSWVVNEIRFNKTNDLKNKAREAYIRDVEMRENKKEQKGGPVFFDITTDLPSLK